MALAIPRPADNLPDSPLLAQIRVSVIGDDVAMPGPFGPRRVTYADYTASGRALSFIEDYIRDQVLPGYANTHTESSGTGLQTTRLREEARAIIKRSVHADDETCLIFCGSGSTGAVNKLLGILNLRIPADLDARYRLGDQIPPTERPVVFIGPFEHHSNELPWRESIADLVTIREDEDGHIDVGHLREELQRYADRPVRIGSFSAASNVTGILSDVASIAELLHEHGALSFWDYAAAGPYVDIAMRPREANRPLAYPDAVMLSPHKFIGGPGTPGILLIRRELLTNTVPEVVGGGTVAYVNDREHRYLPDPEHREEGGTPAIVESIRAGLVFHVKDEVGVDLIRAREADFVDRAIRAWSALPSIEVLGNLSSERLSIVSFVVRRPQGRYLHHNLVVTLLNDLFGIQARGGCSCAGPYGHRLLGIDVARSHEFEDQILHGCSGIKPGWTRVSFNYFISETVFETIVEAVALVSEQGWKLLPWYRFDTASGLWRHYAGAGEPPVRLLDAQFDASGQLQYPVRHDRAPEGALLDYLVEARKLLADLPDTPHREAQSLPAEFEHLRWFDLPAVCVSESA